MGIYIFSIGSREQSYAQISSKQGTRGNKNKLESLNFLFSNFFLIDYIFFLRGRLLFIPFEFDMRKL